MAVQLRHCPVPAVARPFRLLALQQREGIAPIVGAGHRRADRLHQPGVGRELRTRPDARSLTRSATGRRYTRCGSSPATPTSGRPRSTSSARKKTPRWRRGASTFASRDARASESIGDRPRSLSEYLLVLSHGRWISLGFGLFGLGPTLCAHYPPQSTPTLQERRQIFKRLWVKHISCHSADTFSRPRNRNLRIPRADLIMPNTGSTMCLRAA